MNKDKLKESAGELLELITKGVEKGGDVLSEQAPLLLQEVVMYGRVWHTASAIFMLFIIVALVYGAFRFHRWLKGERKIDYEMLMMPAVVITGITVLFAFGHGMMHLRLSIMAWCSPRLYILHEISDLFRGVQ